MKAQEFRIGNFVDTLTGKEVKIPRGVPMRVLNINSFACELLDITKIPAREESWPGFWLYELSPIPLTTEWLERFGFKQWMAQNSINVGGELHTYWDNGKKVFWCVGTIPINGGRFVLTLDHVLRADSHRIEYVHQLQNLYFALTGKELELKAL